MFCIEEVVGCINELPKGKAAGIDGISNEMLKSTSDVLAPILVVLFNKIINTGHFPRMWCEAVLTPLYKGGDNNNLNNWKHKSTNE